MTDGVKNDVLYNLRIHSSIVLYLTSPPLFFDVKSTIRMLSLFLAWIGKKSFSSLLLSLFNSSCLQENYDLSRHFNPRKTQPRKYFLSSVEIVVFVGPDLIKTKQKFSLIWFSVYDLFTRLWSIISHREMKFHYCFLNTLIQLTFVNTPYVMQDIKKLIKWMNVEHYSFKYNKIKDEKCGEVLEFISSYKGN